MDFFCYPYGSPPPTPTYLAYTGMDESLGKSIDVEIDNKEFRKAYGASYFSPFYFSLLIRKLMAQFRKIKLSQQL